MRAAAAGAVVGILGLVAVGLGQPAPAPAAPAPARADDGPPPDPAVAALVKTLDGPDYRAREKAGRDLEALGDKALPHLRRALAETGSPEVSRRLSVLVRRMEHDRLVSPRRVTMPAKSRTAQQAFAEVARQTGYRIDFQGGGRPAGDAAVTLGFDNTPFWQAVDALAEATGTTVNAGGFDDDGVQVNAYGQPNRSPYVAYPGPFKIVATNVHVNRSLPLSSPDPRGVGFTRPSESVNLTFNVFSEPKNPLLGMALQPTVLAAEDDQGQSMAPPANPGFGGSRVSYYGGGSYRSFNLTGSLNLTRGGREAKAIRSLKAKVGVTLLGAIVPEVTVRDPLKAKNLKQAGRTVEVEVDAVTGANGGYSATLTIRKLGGQDPNNPDYNWSNSIWQKVELLDDAGNRYRNYGPSSINTNPGWVSMTLPFQSMDRRGAPQKFGPPTRLVVNEWVQAVHEVTFELRDVPLP